MAKKPKSETLLEKHIPEWLKNFSEEEKAEKQQKLLKFDKFYTYFSGFLKNRGNMFSDQEQHTAIAFRIVNENFPKFYENIKAFNAAPEEVRTNLSRNFPDINLSNNFSVNAFNQVLTQTGIERYNTFVGGIPAESGQEKVQGFNELINEWRQHHPGEKPRKMNLLYKQILSDRNNSWADRLLQDDEDLVSLLKDLYSSLFETTSERETAISEAEKLISDLPEFELQKIWISGKNIPAIALAIFGQWDALNPALEITGDEDATSGKDKLFSWQNVSEAIKSTRETIDESSQNNVTKLTTLLEFFQKIKIAENKNLRFVSINEFAHATEKKLSRAILHAEQAEKLIGNENITSEIKSALDDVMEIFHKIKSLNVPGKLLRNKEVDSTFYTELENIFAPFSSCARVYDSARNYLTKKPYSTEKMKLCFDHHNVASGWVESYTDRSDNGTQAGAYIFRKKNILGEYDYFLGISKNTKLFSVRNAMTIAQENVSEYERFDYYQAKSSSIFGSSYRGEKSYAEDKKELSDFIIAFAKSHGVEINANNEEITPNACIRSVRLLQNGLFEKLCLSSAFQKLNNSLIENLKRTLAGYERVPKLRELCEKKFELFSELIDEISLRTTKKSFRFFPVDRNELTAAISCSDDDKKRLWLFKISNKDLSYAETYAKGIRKNRGRHNLHSLYFLNLFKDGQDVLDIGTGEIFFRKASIHLTEEKKAKGHHYEELKDKFLYPIISKRRFTEDKLFFHLSLTLNYQQEKKGEINEEVNRHILNGGIKHVIGVDRGERNLISISVVDLNGRIIKQRSFNTIDNGRKKEINYQELLKTRETERQDARKSWQTIGKIAELKEGYLSQVVHELSKLIVEHNAIVVLEDLNVGFKRGRFGVERQVYQKFERALIEKLNFLVFKDREATAPGGVLNAYQLTNKFESFESIKKSGNQSGILLYVPAGYTSKIDPTTGSPTSLT